MSSDSDLLGRLSALVDDLEPLAVPAEWQEQLASLCATARLVLGAAAVSVARVDQDGDDGGLVYVAADGEGAEEIVGTRLPAGQGLAGFAATSGQSLAIDRVQDDPRFAHEVAQATGYLPTSLLVVPVTADNGTTLGVLSVLDRATSTGAASADALEVASSFAAQAALVLPRVDLLVRLGPLLVRAVADAVDAVGAGDADLAAGLRRVAEALPEPDGYLVATAALLAELRTRPPATRAAVERVLGELLSLTEPRRRL